MSALPSTGARVVQIIDHFPSDALEVIVSRRLRAISNRVGEVLSRPLVVARIVRGTTKLVMPTSSRSSQQERTHGDSLVVPVRVDDLLDARMILICLVDLLADLL